MRLLLFSHQQALGAADLPKHAATLGLDIGRFQDCLDRGVHAARVRRDLAEGQKAGVRGTPTFFLGMIEDDSHVRVLQVLTGAYPFATFKAAIDAALAAAK